jgi:hypothetical protein
MEDKGDTDDSAADEFLRNQDGVDSHGKNATADGQQKQVEEESFQGFGSARFAFHTFKLRGCHRFLVPWMNGGAGGGKMTARSDDHRGVPGNCSIVLGLVRARGKFLSQILRESTWSTTQPSRRFLPDSYTTQTLICLGLKSLLLR